MTKTEAELQLKAYATIYTQGVIIEKLAEALQKDEKITTARNNIQLLIDLKNQAFQHFLTITPEAENLIKNMETTKEIVQQHFTKAFSELATAILDEI